MNNKIELRNIAGFCPEEAIWKMVVDICVQIEKDATTASVVLSPTSIVVDGETFLLEDENSGTEGFLAPEHVETQKQSEAGTVWAIGAAIYYASSGRLLFGGKGGQYQTQHPSVALPSLQKSHESLTSVMQQCLCTNPADRITLKELETMASQGLAKCRCQKGWITNPTKRTSRHTENNKNETTTIEEWPEEMIE